MNQMGINGWNEGDDMNISPQAGKTHESSPISVIIADDNEGVRAGIRILLDTAPDIHIIGEASDGGAAVSFALNLNPDILLLDMEMPVLNGVQVADKLQQAGSPVRILALSTYDDQQYILGLMERGAYGYLVKDEVHQLLISAIRGVAAGERSWISERVRSRLDKSWDDRQYPQRRNLKSASRRDSHAHSRHDRSNHSM